MGFEACFALATGCLGLALPPSTAPSPQRRRSLLNRKWKSKQARVLRTYDKWVGVEEKPASQLTTRSLSLFVSRSVVDLLQAGANGIGVCCISMAMDGKVEGLWLGKLAAVIHFFFIVVHVRCEQRWIGSRVRIAKRQPHGKEARRAMKTCVSCEQVILTWRERYFDHVGSPLRMRPSHCTSIGLTPAITPNVGNSSV